MSIQTPWGSATRQKAYALGITYYATNRHGGYHVSADRVQAMPEVLRQQIEKIDSLQVTGDAWLEEHNDWSLVALAYPELFSEQDLAFANSTMKCHYPDAWEAFTGKLVQPGESPIRDDQRLKDSHVEVKSYLSLYENVPDGMMGVVTTVGGTREANAAQTCWLVPKSEFDSSRGRFVIDPSRHTKLGESTKFGSYKPQFKNLEKA